MAALAPSDQSEQFRLHRGGMHGLETRVTREVR